MAARVVAAVVAWVAWAAAVAWAVDKSSFKTCQQSGFCRRQRHVAEHTDEQAPYFVVPGTLALQNSKDAGASVVADLEQSGRLYTFTLDLFRGRQFRMRINEKNPIQARYEVQDVIVGVPAPQTDATITAFEDGHVVRFGTLSAGIRHSPFAVEISEDGQPLYSFNNRQFLNIEYLRVKEEIPPPPTAPPAVEGEEPQAAPPDPYAARRTREKQDDYWEETFKTHTDKKPYGPESVGLDILLHGLVHVYGLPERSTSLNLPSTRGPGVTSDPHRLYNLDVFEYELDVPMALYGSIPFVIGHAKDRSLGLLWLNAAETWIDVERFSDGKSPLVSTHWFSESGIIDVWGFVGTTPAQVLFKYTAVTGAPALPREFALAYHQCRWNYNDEADVAAVDAGFDQHDIPYDVLWLDIEHTDSKKYFTWDPVKFPNPTDMINKLSAKHRKMVTIVDPHIKHDSGYSVHNDAKAKSVYVKDENGNDFEGWCWPGTSSWVDFTSPEARQWWADRFSFDNYKGSTRDLHIWNDMNEPSVFNGPEISMHKHARHYRNVEHRDVHNLYGFYQMMATAKGLRQRDSLRPFVLSRAFYAGSQRRGDDAGSYGAIWTGDNKADWTHLRASTPMLLTVSMAGLPFVGADVGGFFGNPDAELLTRWFEAGSFQPFFRGHAHLDSRRREPWVHGEPYTGLIRNVIRRRYSLLPLYYTLFYQASLTGAPVMRPLVFEFPHDTSVFDVQDAFMVGSSLLVQPVVTAGVTAVDVALPGGASQAWFDYETFQRYSGGKSVRVDAPVGRTPVFLRAGSIIPRRDRVRRSSELMHHEPLTLVVAVDSQGKADGQLYLDDGESYAFEHGVFAHKQLSAAGGRLASADVADPVRPVHADGRATFRATNRVGIERIIIVGLPSVPKRAEITVGGSPPTSLDVSGSKTPAGTVIVHLKRPVANAAADWEVSWTM